MYQPCRWNSQASIDSSLHGEAVAGCMKQSRNNDKTDYSVATKRQTSNYMK